jgi:hypothetical protein
VTLSIHSPQGELRTTSIAVTVVRPAVARTGGEGEAAGGSPGEAAALPFGIADVRVDKPTVCRGEPSRIRVTPFHQHTGGEQWLTATIDGVRGWESAFVAPPGAVGMQRVPVTVSQQRDGRVTRATTDVYIEVADCAAPYSLRVDIQAFAEAPEQIGFYAHASSAGVAEYRWNFGDGTSVRTRTAAAFHTYPAEVDRPGGAAASYLVTVDGVAADGTPRGTAYASVAIANPTRLFRAQTAQLQLAVEQRMRPVSDDGAHAVDITLTDADPAEAARLERIAVTLLPCGGGGGRPLAVDLAAVFGRLEVAAGGRIAGRLTIPGPAARGFCRARAEVAGTSRPGGLPVKVAFGLPLEAARGPRPGPLDAEQQAALDDAAGVLDGATVVSRADLRRLEQAGAIQPGTFAVKEGRR